MSTYYNITTWSDAMGFEPPLPGKKPKAEPKVEKEPEPEKKAEPKAEPKAPTPKEDVPTEPPKKVPSNPKDTSAKWVCDPNQATCMAGFVRMIPAEWCKRASAIIASAGQATSGVEPLALPPGYTSGDGAEYSRLKVTISVTWIASVLVHYLLRQRPDLASDPDLGLAISIAPGAQNAPVLHEWFYRQLVPAWFVTKAWREAAYSFTAMNPSEYADYGLWQIIRETGTSIGEKLVRWLGNSDCFNPWGSGRDKRFPIDAVSYGMLGGAAFARFMAYAGKRFPAPATYNADAFTRAFDAEKKWTERVGRLSKAISQRLGSVGIANASPEELALMRLLGLIDWFWSGGPGSAGTKKDKNGLTLVDRVARRVVWAYQISTHAYSSPDLKEWLASLGVADKASIPDK